MKEKKQKTANKRYVKLREREKRERGLSGF
jgi:hypothetical protein